MSYDNIDKYGHCVSCHRNLIIERVVDGRVMKIFLPDKEETEFLLDDGSRMRVCVCRKCKETKDFKDEKFQETIMEAVVNGWRLEVDSLVSDDNKPDWTPETSKRHMDIYSKKKILIHSDSVEKHIVENRIKDIQKDLEKQFSESKDKK